jgi:tRNA pseudouridine13 synthase
VRGRLRVEPEDFVVREWLGFAADGEGDHWLLTVRKRGANTLWVAKQIAKHARIHPRDVGFAGLKDRNAVTEQAFTIPVRSAVSDWSGFAGEGFEVIQAQRHRRKLKRGALRGNDFEITVRDAQFDANELRARLAKIDQQGVPNYFGPQRFGRDGANLTRAHRWFAGEIEPTDRWERGFALSAARAALFNDVLSRRVAAAAWNRLQDGDIANLQGSNSIFAVEQTTPELVERCRILDIHPTGPLWGRGEPATVGSVAALEKEVAQAHSVLAGGLERAGLDQERRSLRLKVEQLSHESEGNTLRLRFRLGRGAFATTVLHELVANVFENGVEEIEEE